MSHAAGRLYRTSTAADYPLRPDIIDLPRLMARTCEYYRASAAARGLTIVCRAEDGVPSAWGDPAAVAVVADNLLSNAVKFSSPGGRIGVTVLPSPGGVACRVCDAGPGVNPADQEQLFEPDARVALSPTAAAPGYGLALVKELVHGMDGRVWVENQPGRGACFSFRIPYASATAQSPHVADVRQR